MGSHGGCGVVAHLGTELLCSPNFSTLENGIKKLSSNKKLLGGGRRLEAIATSSKRLLSNGIFSWPSTFHHVSPISDLPLAE